MVRAVLGYRKLQVQIPLHASCTYTDQTKVPNMFHRGSVFIVIKIQL